MTRRRTCSELYYTASETGGVGKYQYCTLPPGHVEPHGQI